MMPLANRGTCLRPWVVHHLRPWFRRSRAMGPSPMNQETPSRAPPAIGLATIYCWTIVCLSNIIIAMLGYSLDNPNWGVNSKYCPASPNFSLTTYAQILWTQCLRVNWPASWGVTRRDPMRSRGHPQWGADPKPAWCSDSLGPDLVPRARRRDAWNGMKDRLGCSGLEPSSKIRGKSKKGT